MIYPMNTLEIITKTCQDIILKCVGVLAVYIYSFSFGDISYDVLSAVLVLTTFDFLTAIFAARKTKTEITSRRVFRTAWKILVYFMMISAGHLTEVVIGANLFIDEAISSFVAITELVSIIENVAKMGYAIPQKLLHKLEELRDK